MRSVMAVGRVTAQLGVKQVGELLTFTEGPLLRMRSEEPYDFHAVQSHAPSVLLIDNDQHPILHSNHRRTNT